ncbi:ZIP family metal transporter [Muricauda oceani]|uniref:ZIP family metal transporter n=1 Tax=Flagellimonas oceani TaxID=2698672 RepID=A0A6G7IYS6_9FLAO|nr:ZIP family metal transporter [Allomuricauda oceani]MBW8244666.1 ZIP family metal transporter [Allomuricauda oceani]QII43705.1 ZIP family metal transporter [Allomuricauda oceani]
MDFPSAIIYIVPILAVWAGFGFVWFTKPENTDNIKLLLAFSGAFLLSLTFYHLLPSVYSGNNPKIIALYILGGIFLQVFLEFFSKGAEHGHMHIHLQENKFPVLLFASLSIHALVEGVPIHGNDSILYGIIIHKIPIAIILSIFLINSKMKMSTTLLFIGAFSLMTPLGSYLSTSTWVADYGDLLTALAIGVFFHISTIILFESSQGHAFNLRKLMVIVLGIGSAYLV